MGRHFEVRAASMAATAKKKSAIYMRASKEIYMAAKKGVPDPNSNLALRAAIDKYRKGTYLIIDTLSDNSNRALVNVRTIITRKGGHLGDVSYNFEQVGVLDFKYDGSEESLEEILVLGDVDVKEIALEDGIAEVIVDPSSFDKAKEVLKDSGVTDYEFAEVTMRANDNVTLEGEDLTKFKELLDMLDDCEDVQNIYHNVDL